MRVNIRPLKNEKKIIEIIRVIYKVGLLYVNVNPQFCDGRSRTNIFNNDEINLTLAFANTSGIFTQLASFESCLLTKVQIE